MSRRRGVLASALTLSLVLLPGLLPAADFFEGKRVYSRHCVGCHGAQGEGEAAGTPNFRYGNRLMQPDAVLFRTINDGRGGMPAFRGILSEQQMLDVISYMRSLQR